MPRAAALDAVAIDLVPVVMGGGRPFFGSLTPHDARLGDPTTRALTQGPIDDVASA